MKNSMKYVFIAFAILFAAIGGYYLIDYLIDGKDKKDFISSSQEIYKLALTNKTPDTKYFDSEFNKLSDSKLNYHIEFNEDKIIYFLAYDEEHLLEIEEMNVTEKDFEKDKNYSDLTSDNLIATIKYKQDSMNAKYVNNVSEYNNSVEDNTLPEENEEQTNIPEESTPVEPNTNDEEKKEKEYNISFNANGGTGGQTSAVTVKYNELMPSISKTIPKRSGYTFMGWYDNADYTKGKVYYNEVCEATKYYDKNSNTTLYAGWKKDATAVVTPTQNVITYSIDNKPYCKNVITKGYTESEENGAYVYTVHMGRVPNGCYAINVKKVVMDNDNNAVIYVENVYPSVTSICTQAITYPCASVKFSAKPNSIRVIERDKYSESTPEEQDIPNSNNGTLSYTIDKTTNCTSSNLPKTSGVTTQSTSEGYKVIIGMGKKSHGGYSVKINGVDIDSNNNVTITATGTSPDPMATTTQAITYPCAIIIFNKEPNGLKYNLSGIDSGNSYLPTK